MTEIRIAEIRTDGGTQSRAEINQATVSEYIEAMMDKAQFPPITVYFNGESYWLSDGYHRLAAAKALAKTTIEAEVLQGTQEDAQWASYSANGAHGLRRTQADKERAIKAALLHPKGASMSDGLIASHVGVSAPTVAKYRRDLQANSKILESPSRVGADGRVINTAGIGRQTDKPQLNPNPYKVDDRVSFEKRRGTIRYIKGDQCGVYFDASKTTHYYFWNALERIEAIPTSDNNQPVDSDGRLIEVDHVVVSKLFSGDGIVISVSSGQYPAANVRVTGGTVYSSISGNQLTIIGKQHRIEQPSPAPQIERITPEGMMFLEPGIAWRERYNALKDHYGKDKILLAAIGGEYLVFGHDAALVNMTISDIEHGYSPNGAWAIVPVNRVAELNNFELIEYREMMFNADDLKEPAPTPPAPAPALQQWDWVITRTGHIGQITSDTGSRTVYVQTANGTSPRLRESLTKTDAPADDQRMVEEQQVDESLSSLADTDAPAIDQESIKLATRINLHLCAVRDALREMATHNPDLAASLAMSYLTMRQQCLDVMQINVQLEWSDIFEAETVPA